MAIKERGRARLEGFLFTGWFSERFARETQLRGPTAYIADMLDGATDPDLAQAMAEAELTRMAAQWGLEVVDLEADQATE